MIVWDRCGGDRTRQPGIRLREHAIPFLFKAHNQEVENWARDLSSLGLLPYHSPSPSSRLRSFSSSHPGAVLAGFSFLLLYPCFNLPLGSVSRVSLPKGRRRHGTSCPPRRTKGLPTVANKLRAFASPLPYPNLVWVSITFQCVLEDRLPRSANVMSPAQ